jgi:ABC-type multidrug transport system ATPase subunit
MNGRQFIYHMQGLTKTYPPSKKVLDNIHLSFYPDAKIGVLGVNGSGKSTLLRIMAGIDKEFAGDGWVAEGARVGYLEQEPQLDPKMTVRENVMQGVAAKKTLLDRYNELASNYSDETADEMAKLQDEIDSKNLWDLDSQVDQAMDALRCPPDDADVTTLSGGERRRVALARRADQPSRRRERELAGRPSAQLPGRNPDRYPRPLLPRQCHGLDSRTRSRPRHSLPRQLHLLARAEAEAPGTGTT